MIIWLVEVRSWSMVHGALSYNVAGNSNVAMVTVITI